MQYEARYQCRNKVTAKWQDRSVPMGGIVDMGGPIRYTKTFLLDKVIWHLVRIDKCQYVRDVSLWVLIERHDKDHIRGMALCRRVI